MNETQNLMKKLNAANSEKNLAQVVNLNIEKRNRALPVQQPRTVQNVNPAVQLFQTFQYRPPLIYVPMNLISQEIGHFHRLYFEILHQSYVSLLKSFPRFAVKIPLNLAEASEYYSVGHLEAELMSALGRLTSAIYFEKRIMSEELSEEDTKILLHDIRFF